MSFSLHWVALLLVCFVVLQSGCNRESASETLQIKFDEMRSATDEFYAMFLEITNPESAEAMLPELESCHKRMEIAYYELGLAEATTSRTARNIKVEIDDYKAKQEALFQKEFARLKADKTVKAILESFLIRINAVTDWEDPDQRPAPGL